MDEYDILERLGSGGFGVVWEVIHRSNGTRWAMKRLTLNREDEHGVPPCIFREACIMRDIHHPNIARKMGLPNEEIWPGVSSLTYWEEFMERISNCPPTQDFAEYFLKKSGYALDDSGIDLLLRLLTYNPAKRISASEALNHPYLHT
uniref:cyclin-dependent kinase n=1 Tax=Manihot esculenta TaxID=3983 RepID=A0A2C9U3M3_MANES